MSTLPSTSSLALHALNTQHASIANKRARPPAIDRSKVLVDSFWIFSKGSTMKVYKRVDVSVDVVEFSVASDNSIVVLESV